MEDCIGRSTACVIISAGIWARIHAGHFLHLVLNLGRNQYAISGWGHSKVVPTGFGLREQEKKPRTAGGGQAITLEFLVEASGFYTGSLDSDLTQSRRYTHQFRCKPAEIVM